MGTDSAQTRPEAERGVPTVRLLEGRVVTAAWGAPELLEPYGHVPAGGGTRPAAEVWFGAHPRNPSTVVDTDGRRPATELAAREVPDLLVKLLAAGGPLSIQVHPDDATARRGFAREEADGVPLDAPERRFVDPSGKPELVRAVTPMRVLCGLRSAASSRRLLSLLAPTGIDALVEVLGHGDTALDEAVALVLRADAVGVAVMLAAVADGAHEVVRRAELDGPDGAGPAADLVRLARLALDLQARFPGDAGTLVALLLEDADLAPGETIFVAPGTPHAYLSGLGVEVMASSDNVLRGGMTEKAVDVEAFLSLLDTTAVGVPRVGRLPRRSDGTGWHRTIIPSDAFLVDEARVEGRVVVERSGTGVGVLLCLDGRVAVAASDGSAVVLGPGGAVLISPGSGDVAIDGSGTVVHAAPGATRAAPGDGRQPAA
jgi:mannose-6-phosphate isomerase